MARGTGLNADRAEATPRRRQKAQEAEIEAEDAEIIVLDGVYVIELSHRPRQGGELVHANVLHGSDPVRATTRVGAAASGNREATVAAAAAIAQIHAREQSSRSR